MTLFLDHLEQAETIADQVRRATNAPVRLRGYRRLHQLLIGSALSNPSTHSEWLAAIKLSIQLMGGGKEYRRPALFIAVQGHEAFRENSGAAHETRDRIFGAINSVALVEERIDLVQWVYSCTSLASPLRRALLLKARAEAENLPAESAGKKEILQWVNDRAYGVKLSLPYRAPFAPEDRALRAFVLKHAKKGLDLRFAA